MNKENKNMTLYDRTEIQECLSKNMTFKASLHASGKILPQFHGK